MNVLRSIRFISIFCLLLLYCCSSVFSQVYTWRSKFPSAGATVGTNPINPNSVYAEGATGSFYISYNRGATWTQRTSPGLALLRQIFVHPSDTLTIFCASGTGAGLRKSTDYGLSWKTVIPGYNIDGESITCDPVHPDTMYAGRFDNGTVYRSPDRGETWTLMGSTGSVICALAVRPDSVNIVYGGSGGGRISKSTDFGSTWRVVHFGTEFVFQEVPKIVIDPSDPLIAFATVYGENDFRLGVWKTTNGGDDWFQTSLQQIPMWGLVMDPTNTNILYTGTFGTTICEVFKTTDAGLTWNSIGNGLPSRGSIWSLKLHPLEPSKLWAAVTLGSFGFKGIYLWTSSTTTVQGEVLDSLTGTPVTAGYITLPATGDSVNLSQTGGSFSFGYFDGDPSLSPTAHVAAYPYYPRDLQLSFISDSLNSQNILVHKLPTSSIQGSVIDSMTGNPIRTLVNLYSSTSLGTIIHQDSTDVNGIFHFDTLFISYPGVVAYTKLEVTASEIPYTTVTVNPGVLDVGGLNFAIDPRADVFLVGEDSANYSSYYVTALQSLGYKFYPWNIVSKGSAPLSRTNEFKRNTLIYFTGTKHTPLSGAEVESLKTFLDTGGNLFLTGQDIAEMNDTTSLMRDYFGISYGGSPTIYFITGVSVNELFLTNKFWISVGSGAPNQTSADIFSITHPSTRPVLGYGTSADRGIAGVRIDSVGGKSKVVLFGFGFEAIYQPQIQKTVMQKILAYFDGSITVDVKENDGEMLTPLSFGLAQNYPNPFNPVTNFEFRIANLSAKDGSASGGGFVTLKIYNMLGEGIKTLVNEVKQPGVYNVSWDASNMPSGVYYYRLTTSASTEIKKMMLIK